jgi:16S rRNA (cytosine967-C5)-methyltransferase
LQQPDLFLRIRPGKENAVITTLQKAEIGFQQKKATTLTLTNGAKIEDLIALNKDAVVQDYSSQQVGDLMQLAINQTLSSKTKPTISVWDCCAASGGKSIMLYDIYPHIQLTVSDIRESILANLKKRFAEAGIKQYKSFVADLSTPTYQIPNNKFQLIIADVPCSGSGTWGRTPEQLTFFENEKIEEYASLQKKIVANAVKALEKGGYFLYITCSVFKKENEAICDYLQQHSLELIAQKTMIGYTDKADTMFAALLKKI